MYYVAYEDKGPGGPCGQAMSATCCWRTLFVFETREKMRECLDDYKNWRRASPKILGVWSDEHPESWMSGGVKHVETGEKQ